MQQIDPAALSPALQRVLAEYKRKAAEKAKLEAAEQAQRQKQREEKQAFWSNKWTEIKAKENQVHTATRDLKTPCDKCAAKILKGQRYTRRTEITGYGYPEGYHHVTYLRHADTGDCKP